MMAGPYFITAAVLAAIGIAVCVVIVLHARRTSKPVRDIDYSADVPPHRWL